MFNQYMPTKVNECSNLIDYNDDDDENKKNYFNSLQKYVMRVWFCIVERTTHVGNMATKMISSIFFIFYLCMTPSSDVHKARGWPFDIC